MKKVVRVNLEGHRFEPLWDLLDRMNNYQKGEHMRRLIELGMATEKLAAERRAGWPLQRPPATPPVSDSVAAAVAAAVAAPVAASAELSPLLAALLWGSGNP